MNGNHISEQEKNTHQMAYSAAKLNAANAALRLGTLVPVSAGFAGSTTHLALKLSSIEELLSADFILLTPVLLLLFVGSAISAGLLTRAKIIWEFSKRELSRLESKMD